MLDGDRAQREHRGAGDGDGERPRVQARPWPRSIPNALAGAVEPPRRTLGDHGTAFLPARRGTGHVDRSWVDGRRSVGSRAVDHADLALLVVRVVFGLFLAYHGYNKVFGGGGLAGTARWFGSIGMRWPTLQARLAAGTEIGAGLLFAAGLLTPFAAAGMIGVMVVASRRPPRQRFFVFKDGWEYTRRRSPSRPGRSPRSARATSASTTPSASTGRPGTAGSAPSSPASSALGGAAAQLAICYRPQRRGGSVDVTAIATAAGAPTRRRRGRARGAT